MTGVMTGSGAPMKLGLIGAGIMGRNYLRAAKAANIPIAFVSDTNAAAAQTASLEFGCAVIAHPRPADMDAAIIAVPTAFHAAAAGPLVHAGIHCLVEKPFVAAESEGQALIDAAAMAKVVLQVGHIERFNPAVDALFARAIEPVAITSLTAQRMGPASARVTDISVVSDLMVHDLDIVLALKALPVIAVDARGTYDHAEARLTFSDGATATLIASRAAPTRVRTLDVATATGITHLDYIGKSLSTGTSSAQNTQVYTGDALGNELQHFIACIENKTPPRVGGATALAVMALAWRIESALGSAA